MKNLKIITICLLLVAAFSCKNDDDHSNSNNNPNTNPEVFTENFGSEINRDFLGEVVDQNNNPIANATITIGNQTTLTDANGVFIVRDANIYERFGYVKVEKSGYIHGSRSVVPTTGTNKVKIMLLEETIVGTTASGTSETIALTNGASVALEGDYIKEDGSSYSGSVNVIMHHLDPTDEDMSNQMPGMLYAANAQNEERMLQTFGMLAVELRGSNGEDLNLAAGSTAEITVPVDASLLATAPATIPLWYFDEAAGYWKEEGEATLIGNKYIGTVSHFSFWNCDIPTDAVKVCINVTNNNGESISNLLIKLRSTNYGTTEGTTNNLGQVCGLIPSNNILEVFIYNNICGDNPIYTTTISSISTDFAVNLIIPNNTNVIHEKVIGSIYNCSDEPVTNGYVYLEYLQHRSIEYLENGNFEINIIRCTDENSFIIEGINYDDQKSTGRKYFLFNTPFTNLSALNSCNEVSEIFTYQIANHEIINHFENMGYYPGSDYLSIIAGGIGSYNYIWLRIYDFNGTGIYQIDENPNSSVILRDPNGDSTNPKYFIGIINVTSFDSSFEGNIRVIIDGELVNENDPNDRDSFFGSVKAIIE